MRLRDRFLPILLASFALAAGPSAFATTVHPSYFGTSVSFTGIQETSSLGDPEPLFGAPTGVGNQLLFFPTAFIATTSGAGGYDGTGAQLQATITATALGATINTLVINEFGDASLSGPANAGTGVFAGVSGFVTVLQVNGLPVSPTVIGFNAGSSVNGSMTPAALGVAGLDRISNPGTTLWSAGVSVNVASIVPNATKVALSFDNDLYAYTQSAGNLAKIQKKVVDGPAITIAVIPEPGTLVLLSGGLLALTFRARARRA